ncbi:SRPBCC family protein [Granulicella tundricola]|uniref:Cyclase/dehydrase n=1 Tax=Granulicella tundricola (strain ATCC BAA-1859 / DSM 23138 / MP5ACTX9) TaxID=1198114 RepID=E8X1M4_GRATM|nr:SRPBCC family protein [Granulicella tundricola]ADW67943.1 hypothetical protein AciX9_0875 [Granulicella tundricola MP5ACTX9]
MRIEAPVERCFDLARCVEVHLLGTERTGEEAVGGVVTGLIGAGEWVRWRAKHLGVRQELTSRITGFERPAYFQDTMEEGAFRFMQHDHFFRTLADGATEMRDRFCFSAPVPVVGWIVERVFLRGYMERFLLRRNEILKEVAEGDGWRAVLGDRTALG